MLNSLLRAFGLARKHQVVEPAWAERIVAALEKSGLKAKVEHRLQDASRVDILTGYYAVEVDWAPKWAEGVGQSLYYALKTSKKPALLLLIEDVHKEDVFAARAGAVCKNVRPEIALWLFYVPSKRLNMDGAVIQVD